MRGSNEERELDNPDMFPDPNDVLYYLEPMVIGTIIFPVEYQGCIACFVLLLCSGKIMELCLSKRGIQTEFAYVDDLRVMLKYLLPLNEIVEDFFDEVGFCAH